MSSSSHHTTPYQPNFIVNLTYRNKLPPTPYGPYFKNIDIIANLKNEFREYRTSTIEKNYIWQPHFGPDVGINIDLVDQDAILVTDMNAQQNLHVHDRRYINYTSNEKMKGKFNQKPSFDQESKPWWLRNTTYLENNPFHKASTLREEDPSLRTNALKKKLTDPNIDHYSTQFIEQTFQNVEETVKKLQKQNDGKKQLVSSFPILPLPIEEEEAEEGEENNRHSGQKNGKRQKRLHSLVRFDEDPKVVVNVVEGNGNGEGPKSKKYKIDDSIATNVREPIQKDGATNSKGLEITLVAPVSEDQLYDRKSEKHLFEWVKDYRMEINTDGANSNFIVLIDEENKQVLYFPVASRIDLKKIAFENSIPQDCLIVREDS